MTDNTSDAAFPKVDNQVDYVAQEQATLKFWQQHQTFNKLRAQNKGGERWSFLDGPITANNPMGVHHAWGRTYKDCFNRYNAMRGCELRYQNGFDCQGLWVEIEVEKAHNFSTKHQVREFGVDRFVYECKKRVLKYAGIQTEQSIRLGYWMEWDDTSQLKILEENLGTDNQVTITTPKGQQATGTAEELVARLGNPEWGGSYFTFSTKNNETIWAFLKKCHERGKLYRGTDVMPWSGRSGSAYSQMEVADGRKLTVHKSCFARFPLKDREDEYLLIWTTTPWTLTSNVAAAVNPELDYLKVKAKKDGAVYYFAKDNLKYQRLEKEFKEGFGGENKWPKKVPKLKTLEQFFKEQGGFEELGVVKGQDMIGWEYTGPFDHLEAQNTPGGIPENKDMLDKTGVLCHRVVDGGKDSRGNPLVVAGEGTGIVHSAPGCGDVDHVLGKKLGLVNIAPLNEDGRFLEGFGQFTGRKATDPDTPEAVFKSLKERGFLFAVEQYPHIYPHCWRTGDELVFRLVDEWFINMDWRDEIKEVTKQINWLPEDIDGQAKELTWLDNMRDWMISKKRFWGLALPIWVDEETGDFEVMGSLAELKERAVEGWDEFEGHTPHKPWIDKVKIRNPKNGKVMSRIPDVGNPWLDAGIVPYSTMNYDNREEWQKWFPADFITECFPGQFRNWFYALLSMSTMMEGKPPFKNILGHGLVRDEKGDEMHKSTGNSIAFIDGANQMGADIMRWIYTSQHPATNLNFGFTVGEKTRNRVFDTLWNTYAFFCNYAHLDKFSPTDEAMPLAERPEIDRWLISELQLLIQSAKVGYESYLLAPFIADAERFIDNLSNWYVRRNRRRFWRGEAGPDKTAAYATLHEALLTLCQVLAPAIPFVTEKIYQTLRAGEGPESVHLCPFPSADEAKIDHDLTKQMAEAIRFVSMGRSVRSANKLRTRQPLARVMVITTDPTQIAAARTMGDHLLEELNVKEVEVIEDATDLVEYNIQPNLPRLGPRYGRLIGKIRKHLQQADANQLATKARSSEPFTLDLGDTQIELEPEDLLLRFQWAEGFTGAEEQGTLVALDTVLTPALECEGWARDLIRFLQEARKSAGLEPEDRISVNVHCASEALTGALKDHGDHIRSEILCESWSETLKEGEGEALDIRGETIQVVIEKLS